MALAQIANGDGGAAARAKINAALTAVDALIGATSNVNNTSDLAKPVSVAQQTALDLKAPIASPALTGIPTAPTAAPGASTQIANMAAVSAAIQAIVGMSPADLDTLAEIAGRIQSGEANYAALVATISGKLSKGSNLSDLADAATARANLGLGSAALAAAGAFQPADTDLAAIAALATTEYGRSLLTAPNAAALKGALAVTKGELGLGAVENTSDSEKPVSVAQQAALDAKASLLDVYKVVATATYSLQASDNAKLLLCTHPAGCAVTGPNDRVAGFNCIIQQDSASQSVFAAGAGATAGGFPAGAFKTAGQNAQMTVSVKANGGSSAAYVVGGGVA